MIKLYHRACSHDVRFELCKNMRKKSTLRPQQTRDAMGINHIFWAAPILPTSTDVGMFIKITYDTDCANFGILQQTFLWTPAPNLSVVLRVWLRLLVISSAHARRMKKGKTGVKIIKAPTCSMTLTNLTNFGQASINRFGEESKTG